MRVSFLKKISLIFSQNDPREGRAAQNTKRQGDKKPPEGVPELEQMWRDFTQRLNRLFGRKTGGGSDGNFKPDMKGVRIIVAAILAIAVSIWLISGAFMVQEGQTAVIFTFGKYDHSVPAGFNWRWPYPIQSYEIVDLAKKSNVEIGYRGSPKNKQLKEALMLTEDANLVDVQFSVEYRIKNAPDWVLNGRDQEELMVRQVAESAMREVIGNRKLDFVLYEGRSKVAADAGQLMQNILDRYQTGVQITGLLLQSAQPPEQVQPAFEDMGKAVQERARQRNESQTYAEEVISKARSAAFRMVQEADAYRVRVVADAEGDASRFKQVLAEYQKAPVVTRDRMYLETMQQIFSSVTKVMVDVKNGSNVIQLPLDKLVSQQAASPGADSKPIPPQPPVVVSPQPVPAPEAGTSPDTPRQHETINRDGRDARDSREREVR